MINVCDIQVMKPLLSQHGFHFSKAKGQNFLIAPWVPQSIAEQAGVDETAGVLDIDSELVLVFSDGNRLQFDFKAGVNIKGICAGISKYIL